MKCPHCHRDIREAIVLSAAGSIMRRRRGRMTAEEARAKQAGSVIARKRNKLAREAGQPGEAGEKGGKGGKS